MHQEEIALWGKLTAGVTHEMKNVLAIINEFSGLMRDIIDAEQKDFLKHKDKLFYAMETIGRQVYRGGEIVDNLNRFAHSTDEARSDVDVNEISSQVDFLLKRFAGQKEVRMEILPLPPGTGVKLYTNGFRLILTLAGIIYHLLDRTSGLERITFKPEVNKGYVRFQISPHPFSDKTLEGALKPDHFLFLNEALKDLETELEPLGQAGFMIKISTPGA